MANEYKIYTEQLLPPWCLDPSKLPYFDISGSMKDSIISASADAIQDSFIETAPVDALSHIGNNDYIEKPETFNDEQYRAKLKRVWSIWEASGTPALMISEVKELGFQNVAIIPQYLEVSPGVFEPSIPGLFDVKPYFQPPDKPWSNWYLIIGQPHPFKRILWGGEVEGRLLMWGMSHLNGRPVLWGDIDGDATVLARIIRIIRQYKPAWTSCRGILFLLGDSLVWDGFNWGAMGAKYGLNNITGGMALFNIQEDWEA
ncbi:MAG: hypothetical protein EKK57_11060 [Proteobacteria bacterium]|nr:MAG: hypothetical protein EKK57_11060 [Pseudomonadota bacterium]